MLVCLNCNLESQASGPCPACGHTEVTVSQPKTLFQLEQDYHLALDEVNSYAIQMSGQDPDNEYALLAMLASIAAEARDEYFAAKKLPENSFPEVVSES